MEKECKVCREIERTCFNCHQQELKDRPKKEAKEKVEFLKKAKKAGFTKEQAEFLREVSFDVE